MSSAPNLEGILLLEQPFSKVTHDQLKRQLRFQQRLIEREINGCNLIINNLKSVHGKQKEKQGRNVDERQQVDQTNSQTRRKLNHGEGDEPDNLDSMDDSINPDMSIDQSNSSFDVSQEQILLNSKTSQSNVQLEKSLDGMIGRLRGLKRKLSPLPASLNSTLESTKARYNHLQELHSIKSTNSKEFQNWSKIRLDRFISDWMLRRGFRESARLIGNEGWTEGNLTGARGGKGEGIENLIDLALFDELSHIEDSLVTPKSKSNDNEGGGNSCTLALNWCSENKSSLKKVKDSTIEFDLRLQEFIELTRIRTPESLKEAILYARRHLLPLLSQSASIAVSKAEGSNPENINNGAAPTTIARSSGDTSIGIRAINRDLSRNNPTSSSNSKTEETATSSFLTKEQEQEHIQQEKIKSQVLRSMGLLASGPDSWSYQDFYNESRWLVLKENFRKVFLDLHSLPASSFLHISLSAGLSSLKVPACYVPDKLEKAATEIKNSKEDRGDGEIHQPPDHLGRLRIPDVDLGRVVYAVRSSDGTLQAIPNQSEITGGENNADGATPSGAEAGPSEANEVVVGADTSTVDQLNESNITSGGGVARDDNDEIGNPSHGTPNSLPHSLAFHRDTSTLNVEGSPRSGRDLSASSVASFGPSRHHHSHDNGRVSADESSAKNSNFSKSIDCPICDSKGLGLLAKEVPWSHHENSTLVCWISGKLINEENPPMCLPNGRAYSRSALEDLAMKSKDGSTVVCPRTGDHFKFSDLRKVYIS